MQASATCCFACFVVCMIIFPCDTLLYLLLYLLLLYVYLLRRQVLGAPEDVPVINEPSIKRPVQWRSSISRGYAEGVLPL